MGKKGCNVSLLMILALHFAGCTTEPDVFVNRNGVCVHPDDARSIDWIAREVESSASFRRIVAESSHVPRRFRVGPSPAWKPGWFIDSESLDEDPVWVAVGADFDENFWHRWATLRVYRDGRVERQEMRKDGELIWVADN
jgi:hypothetical protein